MLAALVAGAALLGTTTPALAKGEPQLKVRLIEFKVKPARDYVTKGKTKFALKNAGTEVHEFVVVRGDDAAALPTDADGAVDESQIAKKDQIGEVEDIKKGKTVSKIFRLKPGSYVLFCNIVDEEEDGTIVSHFKEGMHTVIDAS
jgi:mRNA-degrading endonuclease RelE of RelBE toxin-antitoxin system